MRLTYSFFFFFFLHLTNKKFLTRYLRKVVLAKEIFFLFSFCILPQLIFLFHIDHDHRGDDDHDEAATQHLLTDDEHKLLSPGNWAA